MAAPSQEYPSWLTPSVSIITDAAGVPVTTSTTVLYLPLTYYGPSIPLNADWTYGGLTPPASTPVPTTSEMPPTTTLITTPPATPTSSLPPSATPSSSVSLSSPTLSLSSSSASSSFSSASTPTSTPVATTSSGLSRGQLIGVIVASILGLIFLFVIALSLFLWCKGRRNRRRDPRFSMITPIDEGYAVVGAEGRSLGEGSPRHSGEEADSFLRRSRGAGSPQQPDPELGGRSSAPPHTGVPRVPVPPTGSLSSSGTSSTNHSGYGVLIERPTLNLLPSTQEELARERRGQILTPEELRRLDEEHVLPHPPADGSPLLPPPRLIDPEFAWTPPLDRPAFKPQSSYLSQVSSYPDAEESATLLTARRVCVEDLAPRSPRLPLTPLDTGSGAGNNGFLAGLGQGLANISRLSWFKNLDGHSPRGSRPHSFLSTPLTDDDIEHGKSLLGPQMAESQSSRGRGFGMGGDRPISTASARSTGTVYHDAFSSLPTTPVLATPLAPLPRALTPSGPEHGWPSSSTFAGEPPTYDLVDTSVTSPSPSTSATHLNLGLPVGFDILDVPAPSAVSPFASTSSVGSLREMSTGSSAGIKAHPFPPGLGPGPSKSWTDTSSSAMQAPGPFAVVSSHSTNAGISIDVLEDAPPSAGEGWRSMALAINSSPGRRTTFGGFIPPPDISEEASLYSMRSHMSPSRSTGSAPASRREMSGSNGSASSRPSAFSAARTGSSGHSLAHSGSIGSEGRKHRHASPTMSAFGHGHRNEVEPPLSPLLNTPPLVHFTERAGTVRSVPSGSTAVDTLVGSSNEPGSPRSQLMQFSGAPWAAGLDKDWTAT